MTGTGGAPLARPKVTIYEAASPTWVADWTTDANRAHRGSLPTGDHKIRIQPNTAGYSDAWYGITWYGDATVLDLSANTTLDFSVTAS